MCQRILVCVAILALAGQVLATDWTDGAGDGDWSNPANWSPILPEAGERVDIESTSPMGWPTLDGGVVSCGQIRIGYEDGTDGELTVTGGANLTVEGELRIARKDGPPKTTGTLNVSGADTEIHVTQRLVCGRYGDAIINMTGGLLQTDAELRIGFRDNASGKIYLSGGTLDIAADPGITIGAGADDVSTVTALIDISGDGRLVLAGDQFTLIETLINDGTIVGHGGTRPVEVAYEGNSTVVTSASPAKAGTPLPADEEIDTLRSVVLSWQSAEGVPSTGGHRLFLSQDVNEVTAGIGGMILDVNEYIPEALLDYSATYFWRVDEANDAGGWNAGDVWSFEIEPFSRPVPGDTIVTAAASHAEGQGPENTVGGVGLDADDVHSKDFLEMWLSEISEPNQAWIQYTFDRVYKMDRVQVWNHNGQAEAIVGFGIKDALIEYSLDGIQWEVWGVEELGRASDVTVTDVNLQGMVAKSVKITGQTNWGGLFGQYGLSEVRFMYMPVRARKLQPVSGQAEVDTDVVLTWHPGREAVSHDIYLGTDPNALPLVDSVSESRFDAFSQDLNLGQTYYWRVDEVNAAEDPGLWEGDMSEFSTVADKSIDDFETYTNDAATLSRVFQTWIDGAGYTNPVTVPGNGTGSFIGHDPSISDIMEKAIVRDGRQSAPIYYGNGSQTVSEVTRTFETAQAWDRGGAKALVLYVHGDPGNALAQLYVKINSTRVDYDGDMEVLQRAGWQKWYVSLGDLPGNALAQVTSLTIGVEGNGTGVFYVDDISLIAEDRTVVTPIDPASDALVAHYAFEGNAGDSTGAHSGEVKGLSKFEPGKVGQAISLAGVFGDYVDVPGFDGVLGSGPITVTAWINTDAVDSGTIVSWGPATPDGGRFGFRVNENRIRSEFSGGNVQGAAIINDGGWHHVAVTVQANATISYPEVTLYVDGQDDTLPTTDDTVIDILDDSAMDARIGARASAEDRWFGGLIDELYIYNRVLTPEEIAGAAGRVAAFDR